MMRRARSSLNWLSCQAVTVRFIPSKLRCIWSTPTDMRLTMERDLECLARTGSKSPWNAILSQTNTRYPTVSARRMDLSLAFLMPIENRQPATKVVSRSRTPNIFIPVWSMAYCSRTTLRWRNPKVSVRAWTTSWWGTGTCVRVAGGTGRVINCSRVMSCVFVWDSVDGDSIWENSFVLFGCEVLVPLIERGCEKGIGELRRSLPAFRPAVKGIALHVDEHRGRSYNSAILYSPAVAT